jgi:Protein of unknown function (DUF3303)
MKRIRRSDGAVAKAKSISRRRAVVQGCIQAGTLRVALHEAPRWCRAMREDAMKFMLTFTIKPETKARDQAIARFQATGGQPPRGVKLLGRWTAADFSGGFVLLEGDDAKALTEFALMWSDLTELKIVPVLEDAELGEVLARRK